MATIDLSNPAGGSAAKHRFVSPSTPAPGFLNDVAPKGSLCTSLDAGKLFIQTGTLASTVWTLVGSQT